jgi:hypothetical protein
LGQGEGRTDIDGHLAIEALQRLRLKRLRLEDAGAIDEDIECAKAIDCGIDDRAGRMVSGQLDGNRFGLGPTLLDCP